jgi:hypothetical protein
VNSRRACLILVSVCVSLSQADVVSEFCFSVPLPGAGAEDSSTSSAAESKRGSSTARSPATPQQTSAAAQPRSIMVQVDVRWQHAVYYVTFRRVDPSFPPFRIEVNC